jgi:hypothetical protein
LTRTYPRASRTNSLSGGHAGAGGRTVFGSFLRLSASELHSVVGTCEHLAIDRFAYLRDALPGLFALGEKPTVEPLLDWLPDRWLLNRARTQPARDVTAG